jgi:hypothetical protein
VTKPRAIHSGRYVSAIGASQYRPPRAVQPFFFLFLSRSRQLGTQSLNFDDRVSQGGVDVSR